MFQSQGPQRASSVLVLLALLFGLRSPLQAQTEPSTNQLKSVQKKDFTRIFGSEDTELVIPESGPTSIQKDPSALQVVAAFVAAVGGSSWTGMEAKGTFISPDKTQTSYPADLKLSNGDSFRLDVSRPKGQQSIRIHGSVGDIQESNGIKHSLPPATALGGLFAFQKLLAVSFPREETSILDQGAITVEGKTLHRITIQEPIFSESDRLPTDKPSVVDLYFDPTSHLLIKSVASVQVDTADRERYLQAVTFSNYQRVNGVLVPFGYSQTLDGNPQWSLQLTQVLVNPALESSLFTF